MNSLFSLLSEQTVRQFGWVLVHFLWQGCAAWILMWAVLKILHKASSNVRYIAACAGLVLTASAPVLTYMMLNEPTTPSAFMPRYNDAPIAEAVPAPEQAEPIVLNMAVPEPPKRSIQTIITEKLEAALPWCVTGWAGGVIALSFWYLGGWCQLQKLRLNGIMNVSQSIEKETSALAHRLGIKKAVGIAGSVLVQVPTLIGWLKPVILLPASALTGLDELQLRAMLAHELAHVRRCDYLVNILQTIVEILGFYHPAVWWMSRRIRTERENCCDDIAVELMQDRAGYAKALVTMEEIRFRQTVFALGADGGSLVNRIGRLLGKNESDRPGSGWLPAAVTFGLVLVLISGIAITAQSPQQSGQRVLHFPADRSIGTIKIQDAQAPRRIMSFYHWIEATDWWNYQWAYLTEAQGDVTIPAGKRAALFVNESGWEDLSPLSALKSDDLYMLTFSTAEDRPRDKCMPHVAHLTGLRELNLGFTDIGTEGLAHIVGLNELEYLTLPDRTTNKGLSYATGLTSLKGLYFTQNTVTDAGLRLLANAASLEELALGGGRLSDGGLAHLAELPKLSYLMLRENFTDAGLAHVKNIRSLRILNLARLPITDAGLAHLEKLTALENLSLRDTAITDLGLAHLKQLPSLKKLDLGGTQITAAGFVHLAEMKSLEYLDLPGETATDEGLGHLSKLTNLKYLSLPGPHYNEPSRDKRLYTDSGLAQLAKLQSLEELMLSGAAVTDAGMEHVAKLANLKRLHLFGCPITNEGLAKLRSLKALQSLDLYESNVTVGGLAHLNSLVNLEELSIKPATRDGATLDISGLKKLAMLTIHTPHNSDDNIVDGDLACLANLKNLRWLQIPRVSTKQRALTDAGIAHLAGLTNMDRLTIGGPALTDQTLAYLKDMKKLDMLNVYGGHFTDKGLKQLEGLKSLQYIRLSGQHQFNRNAIKQLESQLPNLLRFETDSQRAPTPTKPRATSNSSDTKPNESDSIVSAAMMGGFGGAADGPGQSQEETIKETVALTLLITDESGKPVSGAIVGTDVDTRDEGIDLYSKLNWRLRGNDKPVLPTSGENGIVSVDTAGIILQDWETQPKAALYIMHEGRKLGALTGIDTDNPHYERRVTVKPLCHVYGKLISPTLKAQGHPLQWTNVYVYWSKQAVCSHVSERQEFEFWVPPGEYELAAYGAGGKDRENMIAGTEHKRWTINILDGQQELDAGNVELAPEKIATLIGRPAPEIGPMKEWKNGSAVSLADLKGKPVILCFGGKWPGNLPELVELHEQFADRELTIIAIYNCASMQELETNWKQTFNRYGGVEEVPFRIAVDGDGSISEEPKHKPQTATHDRYGIIKYSTIVLVDPEGILVGEIDPHRMKDYLMSYGITPAYTKAHPAWQQRFDEVYRLEEGQAIKRISPPFIPERKDFYYDHDPDQAAAIPEPPDYFTFHWDGKLKPWGMGFMGKEGNTLESVLTASMSVSADQFEGPPELLQLTVPGDWIVRQGLTDEEKLESLEGILQEELGKNISFEKRSVRREVIVAGGTYRFIPPSGTYNDRWIHFYADSLDSDEGSGGGTADTVAELIAVLGKRTGIQGIDETANSSQRINQPYGHHRSSRLSGINDPAKLNLMLSNLEKQTGLRFTVEERTVSKWFITEEGQSPQTGGSGGGMGGMGGGMAEIPSKTAEISSQLEVVNIELEGVVWGKNVLYATVKNNSDTEQLFGVHIYTRSPDYGPEGIGWGTPFFENLNANETKRIRFVYKIQGPVSENTYVSVKLYNPATQENYDYNEPFAERLFKGGDLPKQELPKEMSQEYVYMPLSNKEFKELSLTLETVQSLIAAEEYGMAWDLFTADYKKAEYQSRGFEAFKRQMEPQHPLDSAFLWEKSDFLELSPTRAFVRNGKKQMLATCGASSRMWLINFAQEDNAWKIDWIWGYQPAVLGTQADEEKNSADNSGMLPAGDTGGFGAIPAALQVDLNQKDQISVEARFILADDSLLETIGLKAENSSGRVVKGFANSDEIRAALRTVPITERNLPLERFQTLDDLQVSALIQATRQSKNARQLSAPKAVVLNNETASMQVKTTQRYVDTGDEEKDIDHGLTLDILPSMQDDGQEILVKAHILVTDVLENRTQTSGGKDYEIPYLQVTDVPVHTLVDSGGTLFIVGPEMTVKTDDINALEKRRLYILLKPTIITTPENEQSSN